MIQITSDNYNFYRNALNSYNDTAKEYCRVNKTNGIPCEVTKTFPFADVVDNNLRGQIELYEFKNDAPNKYFVYINEDKRIATTWTGESLGKVYFGSPYRSNFGDKRIRIELFAINGKKYFGTYYKSSGDYARIKLSKKQN